MNISNIKAYIKYSIKHSIKYHIKYIFIKLTQLIKLIKLIILIPILYLLFINKFYAHSSLENYGVSKDLPLTSDHRIKTYKYNPNEIYLFVVHYGFQSQIELDPNESIETITLGDSYAWKVTPIGHRIFIKPLEKNIRTNMTIITNKRNYQFDIVARAVKNDKDLVYLVKFHYPDTYKRAQYKKQYYYN